MLCIHFSMVFDNFFFLSLLCAMIVLFCKALDAEGVSYERRNTMGQFNEQ